MDAKTAAVFYCRDNHIHSPCGGGLIGEVQAKGCEIELEKQARTVYYGMVGVRASRSATYARKHMGVSGKGSCG
eukprot:3142936-Rhodomonas_salina.2